MATPRSRPFSSASLLSAVLVGLAGWLLAASAGLSGCTDGATASCGPEAGCGAGVIVTDAAVVDGALRDGALDASDAGDDTSTDTGDDAAGDDAAGDDAADDSGDDGSSTSDASDDSGDAADDAPAGG